MDCRFDHHLSAGELSLHWLGTPSIELDGCAVRLETQKAMALLAYLSVSDQPVPREALAAMLWPEFDQAHAYANLRRNLASLDKSLGYSWIDANRTTIAIKRNENLTVDVSEYFALIQHARRHCQSSRVPCRECLLHLEQAVAMYRGDFLSCLNFKDCNEFDEWQYFQREEASQELSTALQRLAEGYLEQGDKERAFRYARRWVKLDILNEEAQRFLISAYIQTGQRSSALKQFEDYRRILYQELEQEPEMETLALVEKIFESKSAAKKAPVFTLPAAYTNGAIFESLHGTCSALTLQRFRLAHQEPEI